MRRVGILYHPLLSVAAPLARDLASRLEALSISSWLCSAWEEDTARSSVAGSDLLFSIGGDGTILRTARIALPWPVPILGVILGRLGFMAELSVAEARQRLEDVASGQGWLDERAMLQIEVVTDGHARGLHHALNDAVVGRGAPGKTVERQVRIEGEVISDFKGDGLIMATATGSTAYSLAAGGPILYPQSRDIVLQPLVPHLASDTALVLSPTTTVEVEVREACSP